MTTNRYSDEKILAHPEKIAAFRAGRITAPLYVRIKPTNRCNHACRFCTYSDGTKRSRDDAAQHLQTGMHTAMVERDQMPLPKALELLEDLAAMGTKALTFSGGGEPLYHPEIEAIIARAKTLDFDYSIITNGQLLTGRRAHLLMFAKWVRVSIDYTSAEQMAASRHVAPRLFDEVMINLCEFAAKKPATCDLGVNFIVTRYNCENLVPFAAELKARGVQNVRFSPVYVENFAEYHAPIAASVRAQLAAAQALCTGGFSINTTYDLTSPGKSPVRPFTRCLYAQTVPVVGADLGVYACHNTAYSAHGRIGSIAAQSFRELWFSEATAAWFRQFNPSCVCKHECANHNKVALFNQLAETATDHFV